MTITLVRHAEVEKDYIGCYNGHIDIGLSPKGYEDAQKLGEELKQSDFDAIFCSDLKRAKETLKQFIDPNRVIYTSDLREKSWGRHEGLCFEKICVQDKIEYINYQQWLDALDGESLKIFTSRVCEFLFDYVPLLDAKNILIVTHSGVIKTFISTLQGLTLEDAFSISLPYASFVVYNSETKALDFHDNTIHKDK
ncbi:MAG: alpha-ribazole phosphatase [Sulfurimonas sp.]|jgi:alpha-ribazole phosphatase